MKYAIVMTALVMALSLPVKALEITAPTVPDYASEYMPSDPVNLTEGILEVLRTAINRARPDIREAGRVCISLAAIMMLLSVFRTFPGTSDRTVNLSGAVCLSTVMLNSATALMNLAADTVKAISEYGKMLLPPMTAALAAQGGITSSTALYAGTVMFDAFLSSLISKLLIPMTYVYLAVSTVASATSEDMLSKFRDTVKWMITWVLKTVLYVFTGYIGITGILSGTTDAAALKAAKLTISGVVPVVGGILSDASEAILVSAGSAKNAAGIYGLFAMIALLCGPFLKIGVHYLMVRFTGMICSIFGSKSLSGLIQDFASCMGMMLGMTGAVSMMFLISVMCFMKGVG